MAVNCLHQSFSLEYSKQSNFHIHCKHTGICYEYETYLLHSKEKLQMKQFSVVKNVVWLLQAHSGTVSYAGTLFQVLYASFIYLCSNKQQLG
jgi:hypothetical protein